MQTIINRCESQGKRGLNSQEREQFNKLADEHTGLEASIKAAETSSNLDTMLRGAQNVRDINNILEANLPEIQDSFRLSQAVKSERMKDAHYRSFSNYLRAGENRLSVEDRDTLSQVSAGLPVEVRNAMSTTTGSQGGYLIPQGFSDMLEEAKKWVGGIVGQTGTFTTSTGNPFPWPTVNDTTNRGRWIGQNVQVTETDLVFNQVTFNAYIGSSDIVLVPLALIEDSYFDMDALVARLLGIRMGRLFNNGYTVGAGTTQPTGIITAAVASGNILTLGTGNTTTLVYNNFVDLEHSVDPAYRPGSKYMFGDAVLKTIKKLVDGNGRPLWQPGLTASLREGAAVDPSPNNPRVLGYPYVINSDMAAPAASAYSVLFGDMSTFKTRKVAGGDTLMTLRERYADYLQVGYTLFSRTDSNLIDAGTHPIAVLQQSAS